MKRLYKSRNDKKISGVCGGLAQFIGVDPTIVRLIWAIAAFSGAGLLAYIVCACIVPEEPAESGDSGYDGRYDGPPKSEYHN